MKINKVGYLFFFCFISLFANGQKDSLDVVNTTQKFVTAFSSFDWKTFRNSFSPDATIFFPGWDQKERRAGQVEIENTWIEIFPEFIDSLNRSTMKLDPKDILIQLFDKTAVVTFHLRGDGEFLSRRTIVLRKEKSTWKIIHLHASTLKKTDN